MEGVNWLALLFLLFGKLSNCWEIEPFLLVASGRLRLLQREF